MSTTRLTTVNTQEGIHPTSTATTLDTQSLGSPKAPPTPQEIQRTLSVAQRTQKVCVCVTSYVFTERSAVSILPTRPVA